MDSVNSDGLGTSSEEEVGKEAPKTDGEGKGEQLETKETKEPEVKARDLEEEGEVVDASVETKDTMDPEDKKNVEGVVDQRLSPIEKRLKKQNDELAINEYLMDHPDDKKHKKTIQKYMSHKAYEHVPVEVIAAYLAKDDLMARGADGEREASKKAAETKSPGSAVRKSGKKKDWANMPSAEFDKEWAKDKRKFRS